MSHMCAHACFCIILEKATEGYAQGSNTTYPKTQEEERGAQQAEISPFCFKISIIPIFGATTHNFIFNKSGILNFYPLS